MGVQASRVTVTTSPTLLVGETQSPKTIIVSGASLQSIFVGDSAVTTTSGVAADHLKGLAIRLGQTDKLYGVVGNSTTDIQVLVIS